MRYFDDLGVRIARRWQRGGFHRDEFPPVAYEELARTPPADALRYMEIVEWLATADVCPYQQHFDSSFGQPPVTVFWHPRFYIEVLFWATSTTAIHEHGFGGAFSVLEGTSLETTYVFDARERFGDRILLGDVKLLGSALLPQGTVERIDYGERFIHSAVHLAFPSVTVLARTHSGRSTRPQYQYLPPHVAIDPLHEDQLSARRIQILAFLATIGSPRYAACAVDVIKHGDEAACLAVLQQAHSAASACDGAYAAVLEGAREKYGERVAMLDRVVKELERNSVVMGSRTEIKDPLGRLVLALLLKHTNWGEILDLVRQFAPGTTPLDVVVDALARFSAADVVGIEFEPADDGIVKGLIERALLGRNVPPTALSLTEIETARSLATDALLRPLFAPLVGEPDIGGRR